MKKSNSNAMIHCGFQDGSVGLYSPNNVKGRDKVKIEIECVKSFKYEILGKIRYFGVKICHFWRQNLPFLTKNLLLLGHFSV